MATYTFYPDADPESTSVDGIVSHNLTNPGAVWATIRDGAGTAASSTGGNGAVIQIDPSETTDQWNAINRGIFLFDTSAIVDTETIGSATLSLFGEDKADNGSITPTINIYSSNPDTDTALIASDYATLGTTAFSTAVTYAGWALAYNHFILNASGLAAIDNAGISKFGTRNPEFDVADIEPTWWTTAASNLQAYLADQAGTTNDPKLVVQTGASPGELKTHII